MEKLSKRDRILVTLTIGIFIYIVVGLIAKNIFHIDSYTPSDRRHNTTFGSTPLNVKDKPNVVIKTDTLYIVHGDTVKKIEEKVYDLTIRIQGDKIIESKIVAIENDTMNILE